jgi:hypothetical protein
VSELETKARIAAARFYVRMRRRYWISLFGMNLLIFVVAIPVSAVRSELHPIVRGTLDLLVTVACCACMLWGVVAGIALIGFRCPRCGKRFILSGWRTWPSNQCKHCGLDLGSE